MACNKNSGLFESNPPSNPVMSVISILSGEYYVTYKVKFTENPSIPYTDFYDYKYLLLDISNVSSNTPDSMLILQRLWSITNGVSSYVDLSLFKCGCNVSDTSHITFKSDSINSKPVHQPDLIPLFRNYFDINGRLINGGGRSKSGIREDSIYFYYRYTGFDLPADTIFILVSGVRKSGFSQDVIDH